MMDNDSASPDDIAEWVKISEAAMNSQNNPKETDNPCDYLSFRDAVGKLEAAGIESRDLTKMDRLHISKSLKRYLGAHITITIIAMDKTQSTKGSTDTDTICIDKTMVRTGFDGIRDEIQKRSTYTITKTQ